MSIKINNVDVITDSRAFKVSANTTVNRPSPVIGMIRYNTTLNYFEYHNGVDWGPVLYTKTPPAAKGLSWGDNTTGQLGIDSVLDITSPVSINGGITDWIKISAGGSHSLGIRTNGTAWAWGRNTSGNLGNNSTLAKKSPVSVVGGFTDWVQISAGSEHSVAIRSNGTAWGWGDGANGRLGNNGTADQSSPVSVIGGFTDWIQISGGGQHTLAIRANGTAWAWGEASNGRLGDNTIVDKSSPVSVVGGFTDWVQISAGGSQGSNHGHSLAIRANGTAWAWGFNNYGQLGNNSTTDRSSPVSVVGGFTDWVQISAGEEHSLAIRANGTAWAWGFNDNGQLGIGSIFDGGRSSPVSVVGGFTDWVQISAGEVHSVAIRANGTAWAWGRNSSGQLGNNGTVSRASPVSVVGGFTDWVQISGGDQHTMAVRGSN